MSTSVSFQASQRKENLEVQASVYGEGRVFLRLDDYESEYSGTPTVEPSSVATHLSRDEAVKLAQAILDSAGVDLEGNVLAREYEQEEDYAHTISIDGIRVTVEDSVSTLHSVFLAVMEEGSYGLAVYLTEAQTDELTLALGEAQEAHDKRTKRDEARAARVNKQLSGTEDEEEAWGCGPHCVVCYPDYFDADEW